MTGQSKMTDGWAKAIASAVEVIRNYAVMMENGEVPDMRAPLALLNVAHVIESTPRRKQPLPDTTIPHTDDVAVDRFAWRMKLKLADAREKGRGGWEHCPEPVLMTMLREHVEKGDMRDIANLAMMIWHNMQPPEVAL